MANRSVTFNSKTYSHPGIYSAIDSSMTYSKQSSGSKMIAIIGEATGGEPDTVHFFSTTSQAKKVLKSGELLKACQKAWNPVCKTKDGLSLGGADIIACIRSNRATQATKPFLMGEAKTASIGEIIQDTAETSTGALAVSGTFNGTEAKTLVVEIATAGTKAESGDSGVTFNYYYEEKPSDYLLSSDVAIDEDYEIDSLGLTISFTDGVYAVGDTFTFTAIPAVTKDWVSYEFVSKDYGKANNSIQVKIEDGSTVKGSKKVTMFDAKSDTYEVYDNVGAAFSIKYKGSATKATVSVITDCYGKAIRLQTYLTTGSNPTLDIDVELSKSNFKTMKKLVEYLQGFEDYEVNYEVYCNKACNVTDLQQPINNDIKAGANISMVFADLENQLQTKSSFLSIRTSNRLFVTEMANTDYVSLAGGSEGKTPASWESYFEILKNYDVYYVVPLTADEVIIAECYAHVNEMSESFGYERRMVAGSELGATATQALTAASRLGARASYVYPGFYDLDENGDDTLYAGYILAAQFAGRLAFLPEGETATHDAFRMSSLERELTIDEIAELSDGGVVTFEDKIPYSIYDNSYVYCVLDITTAQSDDILEVERSVGTLADVINKEIRANIESLSIGRKIVVGSLTTIRNTVITILENKRDKEEVIVAFKDVTVYSDNDVVYIEYSVAPAVPNNFTFVTGHFYSEELMIADTAE